MHRLMIVALTLSLFAPNLFAQERRTTEEVEDAPNCAAEVESGQAAFTAARERDEAGTRGETHTHGEAPTSVIAEACAQDLGFPPLPETIEAKPECTEWCSCGVCIGYWIITRNAAVSVIGDIGTNPDDQGQNSAETREERRE